MTPKHALASLVVAAVLVGSGVASAASSDDQTSNDTQDKKPATKSAKQVEKTAQASTGSSSSGKTSDAKGAAAKTNAAVVGEKTQRENDAAAQAPRPPETQPAPGAEACPPPKKPHEASVAIGTATTNAAEVVANVGEDMTRATDKSGHYSPLAIEWNPLGLIVGGRLSIQAEWAPVTHSVIVVNPQFVHTSGDVTTDGVSSNQTFTGVGGEIGYRYYTGHRGMNGIFIGPSVIGGIYNASRPGGDKVFTNFGVAADIGFQGIVANHLVLGGGVGIEYLKVSHDFGDLPTGPSTIAETNLKPRLLLSAGYGF